MLQTLFKYGHADVSTCSCSRCGSRLPPADINVTTDAALCQQCRAVFHFSELVESDDEFLVWDIANSPRGASFKTEPTGFTAYATTRSAQAWFMVPSMCVCSRVGLSGVSVQQFGRGEFDLHRSLMGIAFIMSIVFFWILALMYLCGRVTVVRNADEAIVFEGIGPLGWRRRFRWSEVESVAEGASSRKPRHGPPSRLVMIFFKSGVRPCLKFGSLLSEERRWYLIFALRAQIGKAPGSGGWPNVDQ